MLAHEDWTALNGGRERFRVLLVKPSHYDDDGYVIRWWRSPMPSNSLAASMDRSTTARSARFSGQMSTSTSSPSTKPIRASRIDRIVADMRANGNFGLVGLVGVQSNQYPRALDIAQPLRAAGIPVIIGGFHVSGCLAMLDHVGRRTPEAMDLGVSLFAGEAEGRIDDVLRDAAAGSLEPIYNYIERPAGARRRSRCHSSPAIRFARRLATSPASTLDAAVHFNARSAPSSTCRAASRAGARPDDVERMLRLNWAQGIDRFFITDDNFARNKDWEPIFDRLIKLREEDGMTLALDDPGRHTVPQDPELR